MRKIFALFCLLAAMAAQAASQESVELLIARLDSMIANEDCFRDAKLRKIDEIKSIGRKARTPEERYWNNELLYDEYFVFDADSAMRYVDANLAIARQLGNKQWEYEWKINKSFVLSVMGLVSESGKQLAEIIPEELSDKNKIKYYTQMAYLYSHMGQLSDHRILDNHDYDRISHSFEDSIAKFMQPADPNYLWYEASSHVDSKTLPEGLIAKVKATVDTCSFDSRTDAMNCYILSRLYDRIGDKENRMRYLILSGISDVKIANRDIASINELATIMLDKGDIERAYTYVNYSQNQALRLPNRIRAAALAKTVSKVHALHEKRLRTSQRGLKAALIVVFVILAALVGLLVLYTRRSRQLHKSQKKLETANEELRRNMDEITRSKAERDNLISNLQAADARNKEISMTLREANYVKEECIGATFALCSSYIDRFEKYRNEILKLVKAKKYDELQKETIAATYSNRELKDFYHSFDTLFLNIYPDFVSDFNKLLRPEEQLSVNPGELNTELRIYALVRLGISDSVKIAALLHCSTQTVYNYRLRIRNKAIIPKEGFADAVKSLGKFQQ